MSMQGNWSQTSTNPVNQYKYNGNELQSEFGLNVYDFNQRTYDPTVGRFWQVDPLAEHPNQIDKSPFAYGWNNPIRFNDPDGDCPDCVWDLANVAIGIGSFISNVSEGNYGAAAVDALGVLIDGTATAIPFVPGGAGTAIKTARGAEKTSEVALGLFKSGGKRGGDRAGKNITKKTKSELKEENINSKGGFKCQDCDVDLVDAQKSQKGVKPPSNEAQYDHIYPKKNGGDGSKENGQVLCRDCNRKKSDTSPDEYYNNN